MSTQSPLRIHYIYRFGLENNRQPKEITAGFGKIMTNFTNDSSRNEEMRKMSHPTHGGVSKGWDEIQGIE